MCVTQFDAQQLERGLAATPGAVKSRVFAAIAPLERVTFFRLACTSKSKFHGAFLLWWLTA
jgi:hypothetical protein